MPLINLQAISPDICPEIFTEFLRWMYLGILFDDVDITNKMFLPKLWVLAETFQISELQHAVVSLYRGITNEAREAVIIEPPAIDYIYAHTPANSSLRLLAVETWARHATTAEFSMHRGGLPRPFLGDLCCALIAGRSEVDSFHDELHGTSAQVENQSTASVLTPSSTEPSADPELEAFDDGGFVVD